MISMPFQTDVRKWPAPDHRVAVEQVIRPNLDPQQAAEQAAHGRQVVVHALHQHGVVVDRHARLEQRVANPLRFRRDLARMVEVRLDPHLAGRREQVEQLLVVQPLRQG